jgi:S-adenosyl-L-methionine hydrolase (adenosine-forming)
VILTLLTDYGRDDDFVGVCHAVIAGIAPDIPVLDLTHGVARHDVRGGALILRNTLPYVPPGVHVAVVDPQVGTERRAVALRTEDGRIFVGPDNGLLSLAWEKAGGVVEAVDVTRSPHRLEPVSATFHGRDVFCPVGAHLARGEELAEAGEPLDPDALETLELPEPRREGESLVTHVLSLDRYGNAALNVSHEDLAGTGITLGGQVELRGPAGERFHAVVAQTFADVRPGDILVYEDSYRALSVAINRGDAAATLKLGPDAEVWITPR